MGDRDGGRREGGCERSERKIKRKKKEKESGRKIWRKMSEVRLKRARAGRKLGP